MTGKLRFAKSFLLPLLFFALPATVLFGDDRLAKSIIPILEDNCFDCHAGGGEEGGVTFDHLIEDENPTPGDPKLWNRVLKQVRMGLMPPSDSEPLEAENVRELESWIIANAFGHNPSDPDPGRITVRRLNRTEYRNTIRDLLGVDFNTRINFPPDDSGEGFDNLSDVLSISPMLMEKYIDAAQTIANKVVPLVGRQTPHQLVLGSEFDVSEDCIHDDELSIPFYEPRNALLKFEVENSQDYALEFVLVLAEDYVENASDENRCRVKFFLDKEELIDKEYERDPWKKHPFSFTRKLSKGEHEIRIEVEPLTQEKRKRRLQIRFEDFILKGPLGPEFEVVSEEHAKFFHRPIPESDEERIEFAKELIRPFATKAFRRTVDQETVQRLSQMAQRIWQSKAGSFEQSIQQAYVAILASPRFLFREEFPENKGEGNSQLIDEFSLASRMSYFLWSSMPDEQLLQLASENKLRENLASEIERMKKDRKFKSFYRNFVGQWLQTRDIEGVSINAFSVLLREDFDSEALEKYEEFRELRKTNKRKLDDAGKRKREELLKFLRPLFNKAKKIELNDSLRRAMRQETELLFEHVMTEDKNLTELIDSDYTFLNERLANHYGIDGVKGHRMKKIDLPEDSLRGGLLAHGSMLAVTSNPDRTSPVKRGLFLLDNILGMPTGAPPADIPALEESETTEDGQRVSLRAALAVHRESSLCSSCHNRMDPLGLALENFDPLGRERSDNSIDVSGELVTGESFETLNELKKILANEHKREIYQCISEKMLTFALGRSLEYYDVPTVDQIVRRVEDNGGSGSKLLQAVIDSVAFQRMRHDSANDPSK